MRDFNRTTRKKTGPQIQERVDTGEPRLTTLLLGQASRSLFTEKPILQGISPQSGVEMAQAVHADRYLRCGVRFPWTVRV